MGLRWSEQDLDAYLRRGQPAPISEAAWQAVQWSRSHGRCTGRYHTHDSRRSPTGFPDGRRPRQDPDLLAN